MKNIKCGLLILGVILVGGILGMAQDIVVEPSEVILSLAGGESASGKITISNNTSKKVLLQTLLEDLVNKPGDENIWGLTRWTTIEPSRVQIPPNGEVSISYRINIPEGVEGPHWTRIGFIIITQGAGRDEIYRFLAPNCLIGQEDPNNLVHGAMLIGIDLRQISENEKFFILQVDKTGTGFNKYTGEITIISQSRGEIDVLPVPEFGALPLQSRQVVVPYDGKLLPDIYQIMVKVFLDEKLTISGVFAFKKRE